jgi:Tfp pilus assembly protein PilV
MRITPYVRSGGRDSQRGFALLITITLLSFLVLLLVSLASLTRVETQVASNSQQLSQARQNALMALNIALGQLQKYAGPDQRVTGTADLGGKNGARLTSTTDSPTNTTSVNGISNGLGKVQPGTRYWTGIWGNSDPSDPSQPGTIYEKTPSPVLLNWLISGNETTTFTASTSAVTFGQITGYNGVGSSTAPLFNPTIAPVLPTSATQTGTLKDRTGASRDIVLLVGAASAGTTDRTLPDGSTEKYYDRYVAAPLVDIKADNSTIPGLGNSNGQTTIGRYAYWIGDEGVKAKYNLTDAYTANTDPVNDIKARYRLLSTQRNGIEQIGWLTASADSANFANYPGKNTNNLPATTTAAIENTLIPGQMRLADTSLTNPNAQAGFHNLTTYAKGVLADSYNGGLRRDLTTYLEATSLPAYSSSKPYEPAAAKSIIPTTPTARDNYSPAKGPNWDVLKSFYSTSLYTSAANANSIDVQAADATHVGISPVITQVRLLVGLKKSGTTGQALVSVVLILGNPYTVTLRGDVKFQLRMNQTISNAYPDNAFYLRSACLGSTPTLLAKSGSGGMLDNITFTISGLSIPPGEAICYTNGGDDAAGTTSVPLAPGAPIVPAASATTSKAVAINTGVTWIDTAAKNDLTLVEGSGASPGKNSNIDYILTDTSGKTLTSVLGSDANAGPANIIAGPKDGSTPGYASILILKLRPPSNYGLLLPVSKIRDWRTYCDYNIRAQSIITPGVSFKWDGTKAAPPYECNYSPGAGDFITDITTNTSGTPVGYWGRSVADDPTGSTLLTQLYDAPRASRIGSAYEVPILSMGQLQHANLTADDENVNVGHQPGNAVGNSYFNPYVNRTNGTPKQGRGNRFANSPGTNLNYYDISYFLNCALWDRYFFSTTPPATTGFALGSTLPNNRLKIISTAATDLPNLRDGRLAASNLLVDGAFNINSTSVDAWSALLASTNRLNTRSETTSPTGAVFARSWNQLKGNLPIAASNGTPTKPELTKSEAYAGYRRLTSTQITTLAQAIVKEVRNRGPFVSLAHFINRTLSGKTDTKSLKGPLQTAIDSSGLNGSVATGDGEIVQFNGIDTAPNPQVQTYADIAAATDFIDTDWGSKSTGIPGWLTQADLLQSLGPVLAARSDTFVIRTYGETRSPLDNSTTGQPLARAWCEAVVQRMPSYIDAGNTPEKGDENPATALSTANQTLGRGFKIISFRWLTSEDI